MADVGFKSQGVDFDAIFVRKVDYTVEAICALLQTVDGAGSGLNVDKLVGYHGSDLKCADGCSWTCYTSCSTGCLNGCTGCSGCTGGCTGTCDGCTGCGSIFGDDCSGCGGCQGGSD